MNPYKILGVKRTASLDEIEKAYRKKAMKSHPDRGGDPEEWQKIQQAHDILVDSDSRSYYDTTGQAKVPTVNRETEAALKVIAVAYATAVNDIIEQRADHKIVDVLDVMSRAMQARAQELRKAATHLTTVLGKIKDMAERFVTDGPSNDLKAIVHNQEDATAAQIEGIERELAVLKNARVILKNYKYKYTKALDQGWSSKIKVDDVSFDFSGMIFGTRADRSGG